MALELALGKDDLARYGGPEWVLADWTALDKLSFEELDALERPLWKLWRCSIPSMLTEYYEDTARGHRGGMWLARKLAGIPTPDLADFQIDTRELKARTAAAEVKPGGDEDPPSSSTSPAKGQSKKR